jgi:7-cyano-7-deazaguanine synthase in queuosine biosynthesis
VERFGGGDILRPTALIMFSGGLDSTGVLWKYANDHEDFHVHHLHLVNKENRASAENSAVRSIVDYFGKMRNFGFSESYHEYPCYEGNFLWDSDIFSFMAGAICRSMKTIESVAIGMTASDSARNMPARIERANKIFEAFDTGAKKVYPVLGMTKKQIYEMLPEELRLMTWSCRTPVYESGLAARCGRCKTCRQMSSVVPDDYRHMGLGVDDLVRPGE